jgi:hypothetical protein
LFFFSVFFCFSSAIGSTAIQGVWPQARKVGCHPNLCI